MALLRKYIAMKIEKNTIVSLRYKLSDAQNNIIEEPDTPMFIYTAVMQEPSQRLRVYWMVRILVLRPRSNLSLKMLLENMTPIFSK